MVGGDTAAIGACWSCFFGHGWWLRGCVRWMVFATENCGLISVVASPLERISKGRIPGIVPVAAMLGNWRHWQPIQFCVLFVVLACALLPGLVKEQIRTSTKCCLPFPIRRPIMAQMRPGLRMLCKRHVCTCLK